MRHLRPLLMFGFCGWLAGSLLAAQKFLPDDPLWQDPDQLPIPRPQRIELSQIADLLVSTFLRRPEGEIPPAENVNTLGEVPDSSWFTNRMSVRPLSLEELVRGPNRSEGPDLSQPWKIVAVKAEGITPGFTIRDARGDRYIIKFDPQEYPQLATSAEVISTKFFHAFGYHVPENYLAFIRPENLEISLEARVEENDRERQFSRKDLAYLLSKVPQRPDGSIQVLASRFLPGRPLGPFEYWGVRSDDPNDLYPHQNRRELRGLRVFAAWLNHDDARSINTLDMFLGEGEQGYIRHHLIDFGSTLGSGSVRPQNPRAGHEYIFEWGPSIKAALTLGIWDRPWRKVRYPDYPSVGNFEAEFFHPPDWKPEYPNPAFERMLPQDAFWATKIVQKFNDEMVRALVRTGQLADPEAEEYLVQTLLRRRDKIVRYYFSLLNPLDSFRLSPDGTQLHYENLGLKAGLAKGVSYEYQWFVFDNHSGSRQALGEPQAASGSPLPTPSSSEPYLVVRIRTLTVEQPEWARPVDVYLRNEGEKKVVGVEREG